MQFPHRPPSPIRCQHEEAARRTIAEISAVHGAVAEADELIEPAAQAVLNAFTARNANNAGLTAQHARMAQAHRETPWQRHPVANVQAHSISRCSTSCFGILNETCEGRVIVAQLLASDRRPWICRETTVSVPDTPHARPVMTMGADPSCKDRQVKLPRPLLNRALAAPS
jgi:hypothetical protein